MLAIIRVILILVISTSICIFGIVYCLCVPRSLRRVDIFSHLFSYMAPIVGIKLEIRHTLSLLGHRLDQKYVYIANHQNNYDMLTVSGVLPPNTVTIGKKSLLWIPLFGQLYWLSGNILINRTRSTYYARNILSSMIKIIKFYNMSIWVFPEGTRNRGRGLLPFKTGAFYVAIYTKTPIVPICVSNISNNKIKLNRWSNGIVIIEIMPPIDTDTYHLNQVRNIATYCYNIMKLKIDSLNQEISLRET